MRYYELLERRQEKMREKLLALINHPNTPPKEREAAERMLAKHDVLKTPLPLRKPLDRRLKAYGDQGDERGQTLDIKI